MPVRLAVASATKLNDYYDQVLALRRKSRVKFLVCLCAALMGLLMVGHCLSGNALMAVTLVCSVVAIYAKKWRPKSPATNEGTCELCILVVHLVKIRVLFSYADSKALPETAQPTHDYMDDLMPENSEANNSLLRRAAGDEVSMSTLCDSQTVDSDTDNNSESADELGMDTVPCDYDDSESSSADERGLLPVEPLPKTQIDTPAGGNAPTTNSGNNRFRKNHFTRSSSFPDVPSSSSDEEGISSGLDFKHVSLDQSDSSALQINAVLVAVVKDSGECLENWIEETQRRIDQEAVNPTPQSDSSVDSEFEIIDHE